MELPREKGVYVLILKKDQESSIQIGRLGKLHFKTGFYAYIGSALGRGGFKRVERHINVASGNNSTRKWHIDYLLSESKVENIILLPTNDPIECKLARRLREISGILVIQGFGCTDCKCQTHLIYSENELKSLIIDAIKDIGIENIIIKDKDEM